MAQLDGPHRPGRYPVVVVGSGPGGLQTSYFLERLGIRHALISSDDAPGGMFRRFPIFQRLITWSKPHAPAVRGSGAYEWFDWNSLLGENGHERALVPEFMDGSSYFPARAEMEKGITAFAERARIVCRYRCEWQSTRRDDDGFVLSTSDGEYRCDVIVFAVGMAQPWKPPIEGIEHVPHYVDVGPPQSYEGARVFVIGKRNSGFEIADGLLPWARQILLASPRPTRLSILTHSTAAARARYLQPYEDFALGGGTVVLDAAIERIERATDGYRVHLQSTTTPRALKLDCDRVVAATGFAVPLRDLPELGVATFFQGRLPVQTPFWESATVAGIYFAGAVTQGSIGLKKHGIPSNSAAVHGFRYNARVLARNIAERHFGVALERPEVDRGDVVARLVGLATHAPELWNQQSYLAHVFEFRDEESARDCGIVPLADFVDSTGPSAVALTIETDASGDIHPTMYIRHGDCIEEHALASNPLHEHDTGENRSMLTEVLSRWL